MLLQGRVQSGTIPGPGEATGVGPTSELCLQGEGCRADPPAPDVLTHCLPHCPGLWPGATWSCLPSSAGDNGGPALSPGVSPSPLSEASVPRARLCPPTACLNNGLSAFGVPGLHHSQMCVCPTSRPDLPAGLAASLCAAQLPGLCWDADPVGLKSNAWLLQREREERQLMSRCAHPKSWGLIPEEPDQNMPKSPV